MQVIVGVRNFRVFRMICTARNNFGTGFPQAIHRLVIGIGPR